MSFPKLKDFEGDSVNPNNLLLFNNEGDLLFMNKNRSKILNFDLEKGVLKNEFEANQN